MISEEYKFFSIVLIEISRSIAYLKRLTFNALFVGFTLQPFCTKELDREIQSLRLFKAVALFYYLSTFFTT